MNGVRGPCVCLSPSVPPCLAKPAHQGLSNLHCPFLPPAHPGCWESQILMIQVLCGRKSLLGKREAPHTQFSIALAHKAAASHWNLLPERTSTQHPPHLIPEQGRPHHCLRLFWTASILVRAEAIPHTEPPGPS